MYADAAYGNHQDFKSHTGLVITLGTGPVFVKSTKHTLVTKSSAQAELVALADSATQVLWSREFLQEQGYILGAAKIYQDNQGDMAADLLTKPLQGKDFRRLRQVLLNWRF